MNSPAFTAQLKTFFSFPFQDRESRQQFLIGSALLLAGYIVPFIPGFIVMGYVLRIMRSTAKGEAPVMGTWNDASNLLSLGFRGTLVYLLFTIPALVLFLFGMAAYFGAFLQIPFAEASGTDPTGEIMTSVFLGMAIMFGSLAIGFVLLIVGLIPLPASLAHFVVKDELGAAFRVREWWPIIKANRLGFFISFVMIFGIYTIANFLFVVLYYSIVLICIAYIALLPAGFYALLVGAALFGDAYREGLAALPSGAGAAELPEKAA